MVFYRSKNEVILTQGYSARELQTSTVGLQCVRCCYVVVTLLLHCYMDMHRLRPIILRLDGWLPVKYFIKARNKLETLVDTGSVCFALFPDMEESELQRDLAAQSIMTQHISCDSMRFHVIECEAVKINYSTCDIEELEFDRNMSMPSWVFLPSFDLKSCCV